jgi:hypothetical protein
MIRAQDVSKFYGSKRALGPLSFEIADGEARLQPYESLLATYAPRRVP